MIDRGAGIWCLDITLWLHDLHRNITTWHQALRDKITDEQWAAVLRIKDVWHRLPIYPDQIPGLMSTPPSWKVEYEHPSSSAAGSPTVASPRHNHFQA